MVSAWVNGNPLVLAHTAGSDKSHELTAVPTLMEMLEVGGGSVSVHALTTQKAIAAQIIRLSLSKATPL
jgi:hypothetical protein